ncbi:MAG: cupin domain-containing protein [Armatimonadota bacterium]
MRDAPIARLLDDVEATDCPCGSSTRIITAADDAVMGFHVTEICDADAHFHHRGIEIYFVLEGEGRLVTCGSGYDLAPGTAAYIPPGCVHRGEGDFTAAIAVLPPFDPADEYTVEDELPHPARPPIVRSLDEVEPIRSACGSSRRILTRDDGVAMGLHVVHITEAECHYHTRTTEIYHILDGDGTLRVGSEEYALEPGLTIYVPAGLEHGGEGDFRSIVICAPPFDPDDQIVV